MTPSQFLTKYPSLLEKHGSQRKVALALGVPRTTIQEWLSKADEITFTTTAPKPAIIVKTPKRDTKRFIFTSAQDHTEVHEPFFKNLVAYAEYLGAELIIAGFTYDKRLYEDHSKDESRAWYDHLLRPYMQNRRMQIGPNLDWCGEMNTLPTAVTPLAGFETYTRSHWGILPHAKVQLLSVPTMKHMPAKQIMTTGAVTRPNYVQKRAGIRAHFHHVLGAVLVEIDRDGDHFCRHLLGEKETGNFQDLTCYVEKEVVSEGNRIEAITWGDIHHEQIDPVVAMTSFGITPDSKMVRGDNILDWLAPRHQFFHDVTDFTRRNHHNLKDPHFRLKMLMRGTDSVPESLAGVANFLRQTKRDWAKSIVVESNHDLALLRWLKETDWRDDPANAEFYLRAQLACVEAIKREDDDFSILEWALNGEHSLADIEFLREDDSYPICDGEIECGMHGHLGANGSRGSPKQFTRAGPKANTGHTHSPGIIDGIYTAGTSSKLDLGYNKGLSSWANAHIVTYPNAKRTILTLQNGKYCAA